MKVLSLLQPWASLLLMGVKKYEVRSWKTPYRGPLLIHASAKKPSRREKLFFEEATYFKRYIHNTDLLPYGAIIGQVELTAIYPTDWLLQNWPTVALPQLQQELAFDDYTPGRFAWQVAEPQHLQHYLPLKGTLGLWVYNGAYALKEK